MKKLEIPADLVFVKGESLVSKLIRWFTREYREPKTYANHVAGVIESSIDKPTKICEALWTVKITKLSKYSKKSYEIWRLSTITSDEREKISKDAKKYLNHKYGVFKIMFLALDLLLTKLFRKEIFFFRKLITKDRFPICSWLWAWAYKDVLNYQFGIEPNYATPDDMRDFVQKSEDWDLLYRNN